MRLAAANRAVERLGLGLLKAIQASDPGRLAVDGLAAELASELLGSGDRSLAGGLRGGLTHLQLRRAVDYMRANVARDIALDDIAAVVGLSPFHFARCFRRSAGLPPHRFLTELRIARARELLAEGTRDGAEVAEAAGFCSQSRLIKVFRATLGITPGEYRKILAR